MSLNPGKNMRKMPSLKISLTVIVLMSSILVAGISQMGVQSSAHKSSVTTLDEEISGDGVIRIDNNTELAEVASSGDGSQTNPYIIEGYNIDAHGKGNGLYVGNTTLNFTIKGCTVYNTTRVDQIYKRGGGIALYNVKNGLIINNNCSLSRYGILLEESSSVIIKGNSFTDNEWSGLKIIGSSENTVSKNSFVGGDGLSMEDALNNKFYDNTFEKSNIFFDEKKNTYTSQIITKNNTVRGKPIYYYKNSNMDGVAVPSDAGQVILGNISNMIVENLDMTNGHTGVDIGFSSDITISNNYVRSFHTGIVLVETEGCEIRDNTFENCHFGIDIKENSKENIISDNTFKNGVIGVQLQYSNKNILKENLIFHCSQEGIRAREETIGNEIYKNALLYNNQAGDTYSSDEDIVTIQATDEGGKNRWNSTTRRGNYWREWTEPDHDDNGIVEEPYKIHGSDTYDHFPLSEPPMPVLPTTPRNLTIKSCNSSLNLSWSPPESDGGSEIIEYKIYCNNGSKNLEYIQSVDASKNKFTDQGLQNGQEYFYYVTALNGVGESKPSDKTSAEPDGEPPMINVLYPKERYLNITSFDIIWNGSDSGSGLHHFDVDIDGNKTDVGLESEYKISNLSEGTYNISVIGFDNAGNRASVSFKIKVDMEKPTIVSYYPKGELVKLNSSIKLNFSEPMNKQSIDVDMQGGVIKDYEWKNDSVVEIFSNISKFGESYTVTVNGSDLTGNRLETFRWTFNTTDVGFITGRVFDHEGKPVSGALVRLDTGEFDHSDEEGYYNISAHQGQYTLIISKNGLSDKTLEVEIDAGETKDIGKRELSDANVGATKYDWLILITSIGTAILGAFAVALFIIESRKEEEMEEFDLEEYEEEEGDELPRDFFE